MSEINYCMFILVIESQLTEIETVCESEDKFCPKFKKKKKT